MKVAQIVWTTAGDVDNTLMEFVKSVDWRIELWC